MSVKKIGKGSVACRRLVRWSELALHRDVLKELVATACWASGYQKRVRVVLFCFV